MEKRVVVLKMNPVNAAVGPIFEEGFRALVEKGFLRVVYGGAAQGSYLCQHPSVDEIHITGSDKSFEAIVYGPGPDSARRKAARQPLMDKPVTGELGSITPVVIVPGPWTPAEMDYQTDRIVSWLGQNVGFACNTPHLIVTHAGWPLRQAFLDALREKMASMPLPKAYYPGAKTIHQRFMDQHPEAELFGKPQDDNTRIEDTLEIASAVEQAIEQLRYGAICINQQTPFVYVHPICPWGSFPGQPLENIQSGTGWVHNTVMFGKPQKVVLRAPFMETPKSVFLFNRAKLSHAIARRLVDYEAAPSLWKFLGIFYTAMRG